VNESPAPGSIVMVAWIVEIVLAVVLGSLVGWLVAYWRSRPRRTLFRKTEKPYSADAPLVSRPVSPRLSYSRSSFWHELEPEIFLDIFDTVGQGLLVLDGQQTVLAANSSASRLLGTSFGDLLGRKLWELVQHRPFLDALEHVALGATVTAEVTLHHPRERILRFQVRAWRATSRESQPAPAGVNESAELVLSASAPASRSPSQTDFLIVAVQEVTELRRLQEYRREFLANVSHELKTPLAAIQAAAETLQADALSDPDAARTFLQHILDNAHRLNQLFQDMLHLARIEAGQQRWHREAVDLAEVVQDVVERHRFRAEKKGLRLSTEPPRQTVAAWVDAEALTRILENLLDNAIKYTHQGSVTVRWSQENGTVRLEVQDTGVGIAAEHLPRIFERFYRVDKSRPRQSGGSGLGLAIVKHLVQAMEGTIAVESEPGIGSRFIVRLPVAPAAQ
jgi:two-component system phosphate regulon sensor histidine kinase PhoR